MSDLCIRRLLVSFDGERSTEVRPPPVLGEHNNDVLKEVRERLNSVDED